MLLMKDPAFTTAQAKYVLTMDIQPSCQPNPEILPIVPQSAPYRTAEWISRLASPPLLAALSFWVAALSNPSPKQTYGWALLAIFWMIVIPAVYLVYLYRSGKITDLDVYVRSQRVRPYLLSIGCSAAAWALLERSSAPPVFALITAGGLLETIGLFLVNLRWKISAHAAAAGGLSFLAFLLAGAVALPLLIIVPLVAWSRVHLKRHTLAQTVAGSLWGMASFTLMYLLLS